MDVNTRSVEKHKKASFQFHSARDDVLLNIHHTVDNRTNGTVVRIRFTAVGFSANNERLVAVDHRGNGFVFDLSSQKYWLLSEPLKGVTVVEGLSERGNLVACGNKDGMLFIVDLDEKRPMVKIKAHSGKILGLAQSPDPSVGRHSNRYPTSHTPKDSGTAFAQQGARFLLVTAEQSAKVYLIDGLTEVSRISYGPTAANLVQLHECHWYWGPAGPSLISHGASGIIGAYRISFKLIKELNVMRLIGLYLKTTSPQTIEFERPAWARDGAGGDAPEPVPDADEIERLIKRITEDSPCGSIKAARVTADGRYYAVLCSNSTLAFLALDSWLVCRVVAFSNLFITRYTFLPAAGTLLPGSIASVHRPETTTTMAAAAATATLALVAQTVDNDLLLLNFGQCNRRRPPTAHALPGPRNRCPSESKCYQFCTAPNGRMLAHVLKSGEVLLHNLDAYLQSAGTLSVGREKRAPGATGRTVAPYFYSAKSLLSGSSLAAGSATVTRNGVQRPRYGHDTTVPVQTVACGRQKVKIERQMNAIHSEIAKTLPKERLLPILKEYGAYPAKHRSTIWRTLLELPGDAESYGALRQRGLHPCVTAYDERFGSQDLRTVRSLKKIVSCLAHWCPVFGLIDYLPHFVLPFVRHHPHDPLAVFETVATVLLNQCQLWFEFAPLEPFNYLALVENVLAECEPRLMSLYRNHGIASRAYTMPLMETAFSGCFTGEQWARLWDHVLSNEPYFPVFLIAAYGAVHRGALYAAATRQGDEVGSAGRSSSSSSSSTSTGSSRSRSSGSSRTVANFFHQPSSVDVGRVVRRAYELMERCPDAIHPRNYFKSFVPLGAAARPMPARNTYAGLAPATAAAPAAAAPTAAGSNGIDFDPEPPSPDPPSAGDYWPAASLTERSTDGATYVSFCNFPKTLTEVRCTETGALHAEQRRLEAKIIELEKLEHSLKDRMVNNLIRQEHEERVKKVERHFEEAIGREEQRIEMQRKLLLLHRKQLRERESELSLDLHNAKLINDATVRERELATVLKKLERERQREETDLLFAEEDIKLKELELLARYQCGTGPPTFGSLPTSAVGHRPEHPRYQQALEKLAVQKQKLYDEIDRTYSSLGMASTAGNEYTYRTVADLRKVALSVATDERYRAQKERQQAPAEPCASSRSRSVTSQVKLYEDTMQHMEEQVKHLQRLKNDATKGISLA